MAVVSPQSDLHRRPRLFARLRRGLRRGLRQGLQWGGGLRYQGWTVMVLAIATLVALPVLVVLSSIFQDSSAVWTHLAQTVLPEYLGSSLLLMVGVMGGVLLLGVPTAWLVTMGRFPGRGLFEWALLLPLAAPAYLLAYTYTELLDYFGPLQSGLRALFGWESVQDYWFPQVRSMGGAIAMLSLALYPYVYLLARVAFLEQSLRTVEASRCLGCGPWRSFWQVALPMARPSIAAGLALALMETLNDFGTVQYFGVNTFTTGIYRTWFGMGNQQAASQLAAVLMMVIFGLILLERWSRRQARFYQAASPHQTLTGYELRGMRAIGAMVICGVPIALGLLIPAGYLLQLVLVNGAEAFGHDFWALASRSLGLALLTAGVGLGLALVIAYGLRLQGQGQNWRGRVMRFGAQLASMGYAVPGAVIAVGLMIPLGGLDNAVDGWMVKQFGISTGLLLSGTIAALMLAYVVRFLAVALSTVESSLQGIKPNLDDASRSLGEGAWGTLTRVHLPLLRSGLLTALMLLFVDVMKELPATLVMRPFNFDTLSVRVYQYASDERLATAAGPALAILVVGLVPVLGLSWRIARSRRLG